MNNYISDEANSLQNAAFFFSFNVLCLHLLSHPKHMCLKIFFQQKQSIVWTKYVQNFSSSALILQSELSAETQLRSVKLFMSQNPVVLIALRRLFQQERTKITFAVEWTVLFM